MVERDNYLFLIGFFKNLVDAPSVLTLEFRSKVISHGYTNGPDLIFGP
jgi:hypothetical protein